MMAMRLFSKPIFIFSGGDGVAGVSWFEYEIENVNANMPSVKRRYASQASYMYCLSEAGYRQLPA